ncbi:MAG: UDP-glucose 4-epimerase [Omnitrophica WOR_2 bacterium RIFCSPHIGHO2_02_FULL_48_11]|nr:MAG: UDP-glucose 4-epimerase [Omnitrophica WOR_2 bacterium RIFCSPHIGHO2_02_FULL_48_11]
MSKLQTILITGGAGYVGAVLVPKLIKKGYKVKVLDLYLYGDAVLKEVQGHPNLTEIKGDLRDTKLLEKIMPGTDAVIHLACISNDPSFDLDPGLGKSINYDAFRPLVQIAKKNKVKRFIYASSSSVYGIKETTDVTEELSLEPLTDYSKYKALCEDVLLEEATDDFIVSILRPATVCGYSPRLRLDLTVNILTNHAINKKEITVFGGDQTRPNIHIEDMTDLYVYLLELPDEKIHKKIYNAGYENHKVKDIAKMVQSIVGDHVPIKTVPTDDNRSYHVSSKKIKKELNFAPRHTIEQAILDLKKAFDANKIPNSMTDDRYYNIRTMKTVHLK